LKVCIIFPRLKKESLLPGARASRPPWGKQRKSMNIKGGRDARAPGKDDSLSDFD